jgi:hypothetical protein
VIIPRSTEKFVYKTVAKYPNKIICPYIKSRLFWQYFWNFRLPCFVLRCFIFRGIVGNFRMTLREFVSICVPRNGITSCVLFAEWFGTEIQEFSSFFVPWNGISICFLFRRRGRNGILEFASIFVPLNGIPSCFLFRGRVRNRIPRVFCSAELPSQITICSYILSSAQLFFVGTSQP